MSEWASRFNRGKALCLLLLAQGVGALASSLLLLALSGAYAAILRTVPFKQAVTQIYSSGLGDWRDPLHVKVQIQKLTTPAAVGGGASWLGCRRNTKGAPGPISQDDYMWRSLMVLCSIPAFLGWFFARRLLPESPRFTLMVLGDRREARNAVVRAIGFPVEKDAPVRATEQCTWRDFWRRYSKPAIGLAWLWASTGFVVGVLQEAMVGMPCC